LDLPSQRYSFSDSTLHRLRMQEFKGGKVDPFVEQILEFAT
jgi:hypothetical protein